MLRTRYITVWSESCGVYEQTHSRQCCNLFISWPWTQPVIVLPNVPDKCVRWSKYSTPRLTARMLPVLRVCTMFEGLTEFCFVLRFEFRASLLDFTSQIESLHFCYFCLAYFCSDTVVHVHRQAGQVRSSTACVCRSFRNARGRSAVRAQPWLLQRLLGLGQFVARCALVRNSLQTSCLQWVMTRFHTLDTMLETEDGLPWSTEVKSWK